VCNKETINLYKRRRCICIELITLLLLYFVFIETNQFFVNTVNRGIFKGTATDLNTVFMFKIKNYLTYMFAAEKKRFKTLKLKLNGELPVIYCAIHKPT